MVERWLTDAEYHALEEERRLAEHSSSEEEEELEKEEEVQAVCTRMFVVYQIHL